MDEDDASTETLSLSDDGADPTGNKIPRPLGEPGRPGSGGYNMVVATNWAPRRFIQMRVSIARILRTASLNLYFQKYIYRLIENHLESTVSYVHQDREVIKVVCYEV
jgi:hypothetical protein